MSILPVRSSVLAPPRPAVGRIAPHGLLSPNKSLGAQAAGLLRKVQVHFIRDTVELAPRRETRRALRQRLRAEIEADRIVRKALREQAAAKKRVRQARREQAAIEDTREGRARLAYSASELHQILLTAKRLNIQV